ncbi:MAG: hypothetical protein JSV04_14770 [Candidatus Heimdallarchaeota archaeon]|nr:MAG: hypothetical protein JSV04_14770 [Candidatus Heimdallarchaeota archaeon]
MTFPPNLSKRWELEAQLYASIGTLDLLSRTYEQGELDPNIFHKQHRNLLTTIVAIRAKLEGYDFDLDHFIRSEEIEQLFPFGLEKLRRTEGTDDNARNRIDYTQIKKLPKVAAEFVASAIELLDLLRLEAIATVDRILPYLDELFAILTDARVYGPDHWVTQDINQWIKWMDRQKPGQLLKQDELQKLELQASRWLSDFRRELSNL